MHGAQQLNMRATTFAILGAMLVTGVFSFVTQADYVLGSFVAYDDTIYLGRARFDQALIPPTIPAIYEVVALIGNALPLAGIKLLSLSFFPILAAGCCWWLVLAGAPPLSATLLASAIAVYPAATDQGFFVIGSHPLIGSALLMLSLAIAAASCRCDGAKLILGIAISALLAIAARLTSPTFYIAAACPLLVVIACLLGARTFRQMLVPLILSATPLLFIAYSGVSYHYDELQGWTSFELSNLLSNFGHFLVASITPLWKPAHPILILTPVLLLVLIATLLPSISATNYTLKLAGCLIVVAILTFAPSAITTGYIERYAVAPFIFSALALVTMLGSAFARATPARRLAASIAAACLIPLLSYQGALQRETVWAPVLDTHRMVAALAARDGHKWRPNAQIVIGVSGAMTTPALGANHWSTWYLRLVTDNPSIIGLVGHGARLDTKPFVREYQDHSAEYWEVRDGRSRRVLMRGLEADRPLYAYRLTPATPLPCPSAVHFSGAMNVTVMPGANPRSSANGTPSPQTPNSSDDCAPGPTIEWAIDEWFPESDLP